MKNWKYIEGAKTGNTAHSYKVEVIKRLLHANWSVQEIYELLKKEGYEVDKNFIERMKTGNDTPWEYAHRKPKVINEDKTGAEEFFKQLSDDVKEREKKDDADIEKVGNVDPLLQGKKESDLKNVVYTVRSNKAPEKKFKSRAEAAKYADSLVEQGHFSVHAQKEFDLGAMRYAIDVNLRAPVAVDNKKTSNASLETSVEKGKLGLWNWYVHKDGTIVSGGTSSTEANAKEMARKALEKEKAGNKVGNIKFASDYYDIKQESNGKFYIYVNGGAKTYGPYNSKAEAEEKRQNIFSQRNKTGNFKTGNATYTEADRKRLYELAKKRNKTAQEWAEFDELNRREEQASRELIKKIGKSKTGNSASDDKFAYVMREFDEGKLKTPDGKVVTDPAQAKAIAYSESKKTENGLARARKAMNKGITMWKGNDSAYIKEDGTVSYLENNSFETDKDKFESQESAIKELSKQGYVKK